MKAPAYAPLGSNKRALGTGVNSKHYVQQNAEELVMRQKWSEREYRAFKEWEKRFDRPLRWMLAVAIGLPVVGVVLGAMTK
jgi:hypothetical protein